MSSFLNHHQRFHNSFLSLWVILDSTLCVKYNSLTHSTCCYTHTICVNRSKLGAAVLIHVLVISHIDYCISLLSGLLHIFIHKHQPVHYTAARIIIRTQSAEHVTSTFKCFLRFFCPESCEFMILPLITFKALHSFAPLNLWNAPALHLVVNSTVISLFPALYLICQVIFNRLWRLHPAAP